MLLVVDVFYNLHYLAVGTFGVLTADFSVFHKLFLWELVFKFSRLLSDFVGFDALRKLLVFLGAGYFGRSFCTSRFIHVSFLLSFVRFLKIFDSG